MVDLSECKIIKIKKIRDTRGTLSVLEGNEDIPFDIKRIYYLYDLPTGTARGGHAHYSTIQLLICVRGSFSVIIDNGYEKKSIFLHKPNEGLIIPAGIWCELDNFSPNSIVLSVVSTPFSESDYVRDYDKFIELTKDGTWK